MLGRSHRFLGITSTFWGVNVPCSRTQHGLTCVGLEPPTSGSGVRGINHQATALPHLRWAFSDNLRIILSVLHKNISCGYSLEVRRCYNVHLSRVIRKPTFCICENKDADQLRGNREVDQCLCFRYIDSTIPLLSKPEISRL